MRVLHCIPGMGGGGAERQLAYLAAPLRARGWEVHVALLRDGPNLPRLRMSGAVIHHLTAAGNHDLRIGWQLASLIRQVQPDVVQVWFVQMEVFGGLAAGFLRVPWILSERSSRDAYPPTWKNRLRTAMARRADAIVANSAGGRIYWHEEIGNTTPGHVIPNALPLEEIRGAESGLPAGVELPPEESLVLTVGRFGEEKNIGRLIEALATVVERPHTTAMLCGDGPLRAGLEAEIARRGLARRILTPGYVTDIWRVMKRADVVVAVGVFEGRPNAVLEAMAAGCPLVVSEIPGHREILDDDSARWVNPADPRSMAGGILGVLEDPAGAARRASMARDRVASFSIDAAADAYDAVYRRVVTARSPAGVNQPISRA